MAISKHDRERSSQEWLTGFIRLHILHHAAKEPLVGHWMIEELRRHGYRLSPGTLYPMLRGMEEKGYLRSTGKRLGRRFWREYRATAAGRRALKAAKAKLRELFNELIEES
jgi:DNA-binding PadR family transcriptional regulator